MLQGAKGPKVPKTKRVPVVGAAYTRARLSMHSMGLLAYLLYDHHNLGYLPGSVTCSGPETTARCCSRH